MPNATASICQVDHYYRIGGVVDFASVIELTAASKRLLPPNQPAQLDLGDIDKSNSAIGAYLLEMLRHTNEQLTVVNLSEKLQLWFQITGLTDLLYSTSPD